MSSKKFQTEVAKKIKKIRTERGLLQKDFAQHGFPLRHYQKIESGELNLTLKTLHKLSQALDTEPTELLSKGSALADNFFREIFFDAPIGIIVWELKIPGDLTSFCLREHNKLGAAWVHRSLERSIGKNILEIFPLAAEQGLIKIFSDVVTSGKPKFVPELIRYDKDFPFTVFSTKFMKCGENMVAAMFTNITNEYLATQELKKQKAQILSL